jgi:secondary thiamine-phosphate synthase enzyme
MLIKNKIIEIETKKNYQIIDVTDQAKEFINESTARNGQLLVFSQHTTFAIIINERESGITADSEEFFNSILPKEKYYRHNDLEIRTENLVCSTDGKECLNGHSHLKHFLLGTSVTIPVINGKMAFGTWQWILAVELDCPKKRSIVLQFIGE